MAEPSIEPANNSLTGIVNGELSSVVFSDEQSLFVRASGDYYFIKVGNELISQGKASRS